MHSITVMWLFIAAMAAMAVEAAATKFKFYPSQRLAMKLDVKKVYPKGVMCSRISVSIIGNSRYDEVRLHDVAHTEPLYFGKVPDGMGPSDATATLAAGTVFQVIAYAPVEEGTYNMAVWCEKFGKHRDVLAYSKQFSVVAQRRTPEFAHHKGRVVNISPVAAGKSAVDDDDDDDDDAAQCPELLLSCGRNQVVSYSRAAALLRGSPDTCPACDEGQHPYFAELHLSELDNAQAVIDALNCQSAHAAENVEYNLEVLRVYDLPDNDAFTKQLVYRTQAAISREEALLKQSTKRCSDLVLHNTKAVAPVVLGASIIIHTLLLWVAIVLSPQVAEICLPSTPCRRALTALPRLIGVHHTADLTIDTVPQLQLQAALFTFLLVSFLATFEAENVRNLYSYARDLHVNRRFVVGEIRGQPPRTCTGVLEKFQRYLAATKTESCAAKDALDADDNTGDYTIGGNRGGEVEERAAEEY